MSNDDFLRQSRLAALMDEEEAKPTKPSVEVEQARRLAMMDLDEPDATEQDDALVSDSTKAAMKKAGAAAAIAGKWGWGKAKEAARTAAEKAAAAKADLDARRLAEIQRKAQEAEARRADAMQEAPLVNDGMGALATELRSIVELMDGKVGAPLEDLTTEDVARAMAENPAPIEVAPLEGSADQLSDWAAAMPAPIEQGAHKRPGKRRWILIAAGAAVVLAGGAAYLLTRPEPTTKPAPVVAPIAAPAPIKQPEASATVPETAPATQPQAEPTIDFSAPVPTVESEPASAYGGQAKAEVEPAPAAPAPVQAVKPAPIAPKPQPAKKPTAAPVVAAPKPKAEPKESWQDKAMDDMDAFEKALNADQ